MEILSKPLVLLTAGAVVSYDILTFFFGGANAAEETVRETELNKTYFTDEINTCGHSFDLFPFGGLISGLISAYYRELTGETSIPVICS